MNYNLERTAEKLEELIYNLNKLYAVVYGYKKLPMQQDYEKNARRFTNTLILTPFSFTTKICHNAKVTLYPRAEGILIFPVSHIEEYTVDQVKDMVKRIFGEEIAESIEIYISEQSEIVIFFWYKFIDFFIEEIDINENIDFLISEIEKIINRLIYIKTGKGAEIEQFWLEKIQPVLDIMLSAKSTINFIETTEILLEIKRALLPRGEEKFNITPTEKLEQLCSMFFEK